MPDDADTVWLPEHFIGGHAALDLANAVFDRRIPARDNELLKSARDVGNWFRASGLADDSQAQAVAGIADAGFVERVREIREASYSIFEARVAAGAPPAEALGLLFLRAANGLSTGPLELRGTRLEPGSVRWRDPEAVAAFLAMLSVEAFFTLPAERLRSCPRCGWLFVDTSRGGKRRWCSMRTCGNREKASRHNAHAHRSDGGRIRR
ncbi:CGNR zinc finger domain-containing protein [Inquilinus sp. Marseille-Q2685]|uniref:CGNR zinc finger domain-containing protein n=1 Tax=Inquilinus sp. Marseille-Q2685 TaxID=2866581 RepID=UPI001CE3C31C|nr:CGNR zinc finger domain-containing protein [Inquilinus sp. Marseille-Q2685]